MKQGKIIWLVLVIGLVVLAGLVAIGYQAYSVNRAKPELNTFAQCVADKGWTMYGAYWCAHCQAEKAKYGSAFQYIKYVECPDNAALCEAKGIKGYPTWIGPDGTLHEGEQGLPGMAQLSGCELPL